MKGVYDAPRKLCNDRPRNITVVKDKGGKLLSKDNDIRKRWRNHFADVWNRPVPTEQADITQETPAIDEIEIGYITKEEIRKGVRGMKSGKAAGIDSIIVEMLKSSCRNDHRCAQTRVISNNLGPTEDTRGLE